MSDVGFAINDAYSVLRQFGLSGGGSNRASKRQRTTASVRVAGSRTNTMRNSRDIGVSDPQYVASIRNSKSKYGKRRRENLRNAWYELSKSKHRVWSRFQSFLDNGFAESLGPMKCIFNQSGTSPSGVPSTNSWLPMYCFRLSSLPSGHVDTVGGNLQVSPTVCYQLRVEGSVGTVNRNYVWQRTNINPQLKNTGSETEPKNHYTMTKALGADVNPEGIMGRVPHVNAFRHEWSSIKMTFYPQTSLPVEWKSMLVKFKEDIPSFPPSEGVVIGPEGTPGSIYTAYTGPTSTEVVGDKAAAVTSMWDQYWSGQLLHPHNTDKNHVKTGYGKYPFSVLREERHFLPAREAGTDGAPTRVMHKHFFRNDRQYNSFSANDLRDTNRDTLATYNYMQDKYPNGVRGQGNSPFTTPGDEIWLIVQARGYKQVNTTNELQNELGPTVPSFDFVIKNCHSYNLGDQRTAFVNPGIEAAAAAKEEETKTLDPEETQAVPVEE